MALFSFSAKRGVLCETFFFVFHFAFRKLKKRNMARAGFDAYAEYRKNPLIRDLRLPKEKEECAVRLLEVISYIDTKFEKKGNPPPVFLSDFVASFVLPALRDVAPLAKWISVSGPVGDSTRKEYFSAFTNPQLSLRYAMIRQFQTASVEITEQWLQKRIFIMKKAYYPTDEEAALWSGGQKGGSPSPSPADVPLGDGDGSSSSSAPVEGGEGARSWLQRSQK